MNADGSRPRRLTNSAESDLWPDWSPDGMSIVFMSRRDGNSEIYVMNADGSGQRRLTNNRAFDTNPSWSPNGTQIAFASDRRGNFDIYVMDPDGSGQAALTFSPAADSFPAWSPNARHIAFASDRGGDLDIFVMRRDGTNQTRITRDPATDSSPSWGPKAVLAPPPTPTPTPGPTPTPTPTPAPTPTPVPSVITVDAGNPRQVVLGNPISLAGAHGRSSRQGELLTAQVDWGDGSGFEGAVIIQASGEIVASHTYQETGFYTVRVKVTNAAGRTGVDNTTVSVR